MNGTIIPLDLEGSGGLQQLFIVCGNAIFVFWTIGLAMCFYEAELFKIRCSNPALKN